MKLFNLSTVKQLFATEIKESIYLTSMFSMWFDSVVSEYSIRVSVKDHCNMYRCVVDLYDMTEEKIVKSASLDCETVAQVKEFVKDMMKAANAGDLSDPAPEAPEVPQGEQIAVHRLMDSVWTCVYKHIDADNVELISYDRTNPKGYELEATAHKVDIDETPDRTVIALNLHKPETRDFTQYDHEHFVKRLNVVNKGHVFSFEYSEEKPAPTPPAPEAPALSNLDAEKAIIDVTVTVKAGNGGGYAWCAESEEYKVYADSKADAIKEITEAMILDGITNPVLNIINPERFTVSVGRETSQAATLEEAITISKGWLSTNYNPVIEKVKTQGFARYCGGFNDGSIIDHDFVEPTPPATEPTPEAPEATEGDNVSDYTISTVFAEHGYSKAACEGLDMIYDDKGEQITSIRGSLRTRLAMKWLIADALVNGRCEQQNENDFAALPVGDYFDLVLENGLTVGAEKVSELEVSFSMYGRHTVLVFVNHWLVVNNPAYKEAFAALPVGTELKCSGERFTVRSHSMGADNAPRVGLVNGNGQVMSLSVESMLSEIASGKSERVEQQSNIEKFKALPMGETIEIEFPTGRAVEAIKTGDRTFHFNNYGTFKKAIVTHTQRLNIGWPISPNYKLINDPHNSKKQYLLKRENFQEITVFQLIDGVQVGRVKLTEEELLSTYDFMYQYQLNKLLSMGSNSAARLYKIKHSFLSGISKNWRIDAKLLCINPDSLNFLTHVAREEALKPLIVRTAKAMKAVSGWGSWWLNKPVDAVLREAEAAGFVVRASTTQIHWSDAGITELRKYA